MKPNWKSGNCYTLQLYRPLDVAPVVQRSFVQSCTAYGQKLLFSSFCQNSDIAIINSLTRFPKQSNNLVIMNVFKCFFHCTDRNMPYFHF